VRFRTGLISLAKATNRRLFMNLNISQRREISGRLGSYAVPWSWSVQIGQFMAKVRKKCRMAVCQEGGKVTKRLRLALKFLSPERNNCRSQCPSGLKHKLSSPTRTLGS
jgi:hypothetical protein